LAAIGAFWHGWRAMKTCIAPYAPGRYPRGARGLSRQEGPVADTVPKHWTQSTWEEKAKENPLFAVMTMPEMADAGADGFDEQHLDAFFAKGEALFAAHVAPLIAAAPKRGLVVEYGCGAGRILKAVAGAGHRAAGIDISPTMIGHCRRLVAAAESLHCLDEKGRTDLPDASASVVYSYAVVQHIASLEDYVKAIDEMCRVLAPGGTLGVQVNCEDFVSGDFDKRDRTENFEDHSLHYRADETKPYRRHDQNNWSGVYIGDNTLVRLLDERGVKVERRYYHNPKKLRAVWYVCRKSG
jgi:SAM-dependent methyltransferase